MLKRRIALNLSILLISVLAPQGCASLAETDRGLLNTPAMDLRTRQTPEQSSVLTTLGSLKKGNAGGACTVCAH